MLPVMAGAGNYCTHCMPRAHEVSPGPRVGMQQHLKGYSKVTACWYTSQEPSTCAFQEGQCKHTTIYFSCTLNVARFIKDCISCACVRCCIQSCALVAVQNGFVRNHLSHYRHLICSGQPHSPTTHATACATGRSGVCTCCAGGHDLHHTSSSTSNKATQSASI
jgi:hypothetical protein